MGELAVKQESEVSAVTDISGGLLDVISRAARDPNVDIDKMERLLAMQERVIERNAKIAFIEAKRTMRPELPIITERGRIIVREKGQTGKRDGDIIQDTSFARFEDLNEEVLPIVSRHGFDISFRNATAPDGKVRVYTILTHILGHSEETYFDLPHDSSGSKNSVQAIGSSTSYAKRYGLLAILNITTKGQDDDAQSACPPDLVSIEQLDELLRRASEVGADLEKFCKHMKVVGLAQLPASKYETAMKALDAKARTK